MPQKRILIIDDNAIARFALRRSIENDQFVVCGEAEDGQHGIEKAKETLPDLIFLDLLMPGMNGNEVAPILKKHLPNVPIILFTLHPESAQNVLDASVGIDLVVSKPARISHLLNSVRSLLQS